MPGHFQPVLSTSAGRWKEGSQISRHCCPTSRMSISPDTEGRSSTPISITRPAMNGGLLGKRDRPAAECPSQTFVVVDDGQSVVDAVERRAKERHVHRAPVALQSDRAGDVGNRLLQQSAGCPNPSPSPRSIRRDVRARRPDSSVHMNPHRHTPAESPLSSRTAAYRGGDARCRRRSSGGRTGTIRSSGRSALRRSRTA